MTINSLKVSTKTTKTITLSWKTDNKVAKVYYKLDSGSDVLYNQPNATSGTIQITGLSPNRSYSIRVTVENSSGTELASSNISVSTYAKPNIASYETLEVGDNITLTINNPSGNNLSLKLKTIEWQGTTIIDTGEIFQKSITAGTHTIVLNEEEQKAIYANYQNVTTSENNNFAFELRDSENNASLEPVVWHFNGNLPTIKQLEMRTDPYYAKWRQAYVWLKVNSEWVRGATWVKANGTWRRGY